MARAAKRKGLQVERQLVALHRDEGIPCWRVPMSGALGGSLHGDLKIGPDREFTAEVKARRSGAGFKTLERWAKGCQLLFLVRDYAPPMVAMSWDTYVELMKSLGTRAE